jgi:hypothetical protein
MAKLLAILCSIVGLALGLGCSDEDQESLGEDHGKSRPDSTKIEQQVDAGQSLTRGAPSPAGTVLHHFFDLLETGQAAEARKFFLIQTPEQERGVREFIDQGIAFFAGQRLSNEVLETFADDRFAVCAVEQRPLDKPDLREIEAAFLVHVGGEWLLLPEPQDHRSELNDLSQAELAALDLLKEKFLVFKRQLR